MDFFLLWSGEVAGMHKARIPATPCKGFLHRVDETGAAVVPDISAIAEALPSRLRTAFERAPMTEVKDIGGKQCRRQPPLMFDLCRLDGSWITRLYLQPLDAHFAAQRRNGRA